MRFHPPPLAVGAEETAWLLDAAFGSAPPAAGLDVERVLGLGARLDLLPRIAARTPPDTLRSALGDEGLALLLLRHAECGRRARGLATLARELGATGLPIALLKFGALQHAGVLRPGARAAGDLDVLAPEDALGDVQAVLRRGGFRPFAAAPEADHQLAPLQDESGRVVEVHRSLPGVVVPGRRRFARWADLEEEGLLAAADATGLRLPVRAVLAAHAVAHGVAQHGLAPRSYPLLRMVADVVDLGPGSLADARPLLARSVGADEIEAVGSLARRLAAGHAVELIASPEPAGTLLRHVLAGVLDDDYARSLKLAYALRPLSEEPRALALARVLRATLFPTSSQLDGLYGEERSPWSGLRRPLDFAHRVLRHGVHRARARLGRKG
jgi:hypothetical protein